MTIPNENNRDDALGNGAVNIFPYNFRIIVDADLEVTVVNLTGVETLLVLNTDYSVQGKGNNTGTITLLDLGQAFLTSGFLTSGFGITILRDPAVTQPTDIKNQGSNFNAKTHEDAFDRQVMIMQKFLEILGRQLTLPDTEAGSLSKITIPSLTDRAGNFLAFAAVTGDLIASAGTPGSVAVSTFIETFLGKTNFIEALNSIGFDKGTNIVAATTTDLGNATGNFVDVTHASGTVTTTSMGGATVKAGTRLLTQYLITTGTVTLTHNATTLILPDGLNLQIADKDLIVWRKLDDASANWVVEGILRNKWFDALNVLGFNQGGSIASAATVDFGTATGNYVTTTHLSGTTAITSKGGATIRQGTRVLVRYSISGGTLTLTHNGTSLILPGAANITLADGDLIEWIKESDTAANWRANLVSKASGEPPVSQRSGVSQVRLVLASATVLRLDSEGGDEIEINGEIVTIPGAGNALNTTDNLITSTGADSGGAMTASAFFHIYRSNGAASPFPNQVRASSTAPSALNGQQMLGTTGNEANWKHIGWVFTNASSQLSATESFRSVKSRFNRRRLVLRASGAYLDDNVRTESSTTSTTWTQGNGGTGSTVTFIADGVEDVSAHVHHYGFPFGAGRSIDVGISALDSTVNVDSGNTQVAATREGMPCNSRFAAPSEGKHTVDLMVRASSAEAATTTWDDVRNGSATDPRKTSLILETTY